MQHTGILEYREGETLAVSFLDLFRLWLGFSFVLEVSIKKKKNICDFDIADSPLSSSVCLVMKMVWKSEPATHHRTHNWFS